MLGEFEQISELMAPLAKKVKGAFSLENDGAVFDCPVDHEIVVSTDTLISSVHFFEKDRPEDIASKLIGVNLSDLAAMGAKPLHYTLNCSYPSSTTIEWIEAFTSQLSSLQERFDFTLIGGDTTRTHGPLTLSLTAFGTLPKGQSLLRTSAQVNDLICVSETIGNAALGLKYLLGDLETTSPDLFLEQYHRPQPRIALGQALRGHATACLDISDGLISDFKHMKKGGVIYFEKIPLSEPAKICLARDSSLQQVILNGGDDYELLFTIPFEKEFLLHEMSIETATKITVIGRITEANDLKIIDSFGHEITNIASGYRHF